MAYVFFFSSRRRHTRWPRDWSSDVCSSDLRRIRDEAQSFADKIQIEVQQTTGGVEVKTVYPDEHAWHIRIGKSPSYSVNYDIAMPSDAPLNVRNSFGNTEASGIHASVDIQNNNGSVSMR